MDQKTRVQIAVLFPIILGLIMVVSLWVVFRKGVAGSGTGNILFLAVFFGIVALVMAGILYAMSRSFAHRIGTLETEAKRVRSGDFARPVPISGQDEVAEISKVFNQMTGELQSYLKLVKEHSKLKTKLEQVQDAAESMRHNNIDLSDSLERLKRAQEQILEKEHVDILLPMLSGITHDYNEGLTSILAMTELLHKHPDKASNPEEVKHWYESIEKIALESRDRIQSLAEYSESTTSQAEPLQVRDVVQKSIRVTRPKWEQEAEAQGVSIKVETEFGDAGTINGVTGDLIKMFIHVIFNAVEAMPEGGTITVKTSDDAGGVSIQIIDTGIGMDSKLQERCLRPFFSTKDGSAGVGLTVAKGIARQHGGRLGIVSEAGQGTTVFIELPTGTLEVATEETTEDMPKLGRKLRILLVEDDAWTMDFIAESLRADGHAVETATNGLEGLEKYHQGKYEMVITDRAMPEMNGDELARVIKRIYPYEPIIMLTGFGEIMKGRGQVPPDVDGVVSKPVKIGRLEGAMAEALLKTGQAVG